MFFYFAFFLLRKKEHMIYLQIIAHDYSVLKVLETQ